ncbi:MAG: hypothetical protein A3G81_25185 [Betaproteobacteria bacterium RIFCSPLOWO2_12_FULL_65_14]|nr:MAG: hypothetical protein A3G81_25185 [Betaproteobacteria bacterium RIFCSPLOWO2_12_FULL_65_14]
MKRILTIGFALVAVAAFPAANASEDSEYEREGWAALEAAQSSAGTSGSTASLSDSVWAKDHNFISPAP